MTSEHHVGWTQRLGMIAGAIVVVLVVLGFVYAQGRLRAASQSPASPPVASTGTQTPAPLDDLADPIFTPAEAISRTLAMMKTYPGGPRENLQYHEAIARLMTYDDAVQHWLGLVDEPASRNGPAWIVGILTDGLDASQVTLMSGSNTSAVPAEGGWIAWDANSGAMMASGPLSPVWDRNAAALRALPDASLPIAKATPAPYTPESSHSTPTPTLAP